MFTNQDCVNARLVRFEQGAFSDIPGVPTNIPKPYYFAFVFKKGGIEYREMFVSLDSNFDLGQYLPFIGKIVEKVERNEGKTTFYFTDGTGLWMT